MSLSGPLPMDAHPSSPELGDPRRLALLESYRILDTPTEREFDELCKFAAQLCGTPMAVINFLDGERQWFKSEVGMGERQHSLERAVCRYTVQKEALMVVPDLLLDPRFAGHLPKGGGAPLRFYAGAVIRSREGVALGTVCVFDHQPRQLDALQTDALQTLARQVSTLLELRREALDARRLAATRGEINVHLSGAAPLRETLQRCTQSVVDYLQGAFARVWTLDEAAGVLILQASAGCYTHLDGPHGRVRVGEFKIGRIARDQQPLLTNDVRHDPNISDPAWAQRENMVAFAGYPLLIDGRTLGVLAVFWRHEVSAMLLEDLAPVAQSIAQFIERKTTEAALVQTAEQRRLALDSAQLGWWHFDLVNDNVYWDERFKTIFGVRDEELSYERVLSRLHPEDRKSVDAAVKAAIRPDDPSPYAIEYRVVQDDGSLHWVQARGKAHFVGEGEARRAVTIVGTVMDISQAKAAEEALRANEEKYRSIFESIDTGFCVIEMIWDGQGNAADYRFLEMNPAFVAHTGMHGVVGKTIREIHPDFEQVFIDRYVRVARTGEAIRFEEGSEAMGRWFEVYAFALRQGSPDRIAVLFSDISERRRSELALQAAKTEAERTSQMKDEFLATLSHELRTPLNAILGWAQVLRDSQQDPEDDLAQGLATIERNARAQTQIIEDLLDMSRIISGKVRLDVQRLDLAMALEAAIDTMRPAADAKGIRLQAVLDPVARPVSGDPNRLQQVFWNLLSNAIKFTPKGGRVQVVLERVNSHLEISVIDSGEGISADFLPHVFDRFRQQDASTTRRHGGLGLGLAIVKQLVELHGGGVRVKSGGPGAGATFVVSLPLTVLHPEAEPVEAERRHPRASSSRVALPSGGLDLGGVKVLVLDDEADARALVKRLLEDRGALVRVAGTVEEALRLLGEEKPDVLVSDIGMPGEDGYSLIRRVRALGAARGGDVPAVALTAYARAEDRMKAILAGFQMHVSKPVEPAELLTMVASLAGRTGGV